MRAMAVTRYGGPLEELVLPAPEVRRGHALVEVEACGICQSDVKVARGKMPFSPTLRLPHVPGHEICGRVIETDPAGALEPGTRVLVTAHVACGQCGRCVAGQPQLCRDLETFGFTLPGGFQERMVVPLTNLVAIPPNLDSTQAALIGCAIGTAYRAAVTRGGIRPGMRVAVLGLGGVGIHALQFVRLAGAIGVGLDISEAAVGAARDLGLDGRIADDPAVEIEVLEGLGEGDGLDVVIDAVGHPATLERATRLVRKGGRIVVVGYGLDSFLAIPSHRLALDELELLGSRNVTRAEIEQVIRLITAGRLEVVIDRVEPLVRANDLLDDLEAGKVVGRCVLLVAI